MCGQKLSSALLLLTQRCSFQSFALNQSAFFFLSYKMKDCVAVSLQIHSALNLGVLQLLKGIPLLSTFEFSTFGLLMSHEDLQLDPCFRFCEPIPFPSLIHHHAYTVCISPLWLSVKQYFTSLKPSQDVCFWRVLICILNIPNAGHFVNFWYTYMNDFYFHCHDKDLWSSSLLCRLYWWWKMSHIFFVCLFPFV